MSQEKEIIIQQISKSRFRFFVMFTKNPKLSSLSEEIEYYANEKVTILGTIVLDYYDNDFGAIVLCRDEYGKFRAIESESDFISIDDSRVWLKQKIRRYTNENIIQVPQGTGSPGIDLFKKLNNHDKLHPYFIKLNNDNHNNAAKQIIIEAMRFFNDVDGNFVEQFQSINGFDSRLWEIYLFCFLTEQEFIISRSESNPDFMIKKHDNDIALEAVIVDRKDSNPPKEFTPIKQIIPEVLEKGRFNQQVRHLRNYLQKHLIKEIPRGSASGCKGKFENLRFS